MGMDFVKIQEKFRFFSLPNMGFCARMISRIIVGYCVIQIIPTQGDLLHQIGILCIKKEDIPLDSRCGSVETCRKASGILLSGRKNAREMVGAFRVRKLWQA